ncbi:RNA 2',3'-cyclic phosphodiesterase [Candidatus Poribacteria bacterium]|nr:RNA 2',3'-cyclic phosphodiesterase [Candidatus Poribacteria bacterium]
MKNKKKETIRTFIAIKLPENIHKVLKQLQDELKESMPDVRWTKYGNIHLTLKFLGDTPVSQVDFIDEKLREISGKFSSFNMILEGVGAFPNSRKPRIIWAGINTTDETLENLAKQIEKEMDKIGFPKEKRKFKPHLTIGRIRKLNNPTVMSKVLENIQIRKIGEFTVESVSFIESQLDPGGSIYTTLCDAPLSI